jgi:hypothetical protein
VEKADIPEVRTLQKAAMKTRGDSLVTDIASSSDDRGPLYALKSLSDERLDDCLKNALHDVPSITREAITIITESDDSKWCSDIWQFVGRIESANGPRDAALWLECAEYLLRHGDRAGEIEKALPTIASPHLGRVAILALRYFPSMAVQAFRRALRSTAPCDRRTAAAALAIIDKPWSRKELTNVLDESNDRDLTAECRSALTHTHSVEAHQKVADWDISNPAVGEAVDHDGDRQQRLRETDDSISFEMQQLHDTVMPLRSVVVDPE